MFNFEYHGTKDHRIIALSSESLTFLRLLNITFQKIPRRYCGAVHDPTIESTLKTAASNVNAKAFKAAKKAYVDNQTRLKRFRYWQEVQSHYRDPETWKGLIAKATPQNQSKLQHLQRRFMLHAEWAHCSSEAMYQVASDIIPALDAYFEMAELELEAMHSKLSPQVRTDLKAFINDGKNWLSKAKLSLTHAMVARLIVSSKTQQVGRDDVVHELMTKLHEAGIKVKPFSSPSLGMSAKHINFFQQFIAKHSSKQIALHLKHEVSWLHADQTFDVITRPYCIYVVPKKITPLIVISRFGRFWQRLVGNFDVERYLLSQQHTFASVRLLERQMMTGHPSQEVTQRMKEMMQLHESLELECQSLTEKLPQGIWGSLWRRDSKGKLTKLMSHWQQSQSLIGEKTLLLLSDCITTLEKNTGVEPRPVLTSSMKEEIFKGIAWVKAIHRRTPLRNVAVLATLDARFEAVYKKLHPEEPLLELHLKELEQGKLLGNGHLDTFYIMLKNLKTVDAHSFKAFKRRAIPARKAILLVFKQTLQAFMQQKEGMAESTLQTLMRALLCLSHLGDDHEKDKIKDHVLQLLSLYANRTIKEETDINASWHAYSEAILLQVADHMAIPELRQEAETLQSLRLGGKTIEHREYCAKYLKTLALSQLKTQAEDALSNYEDTLWKVLRNKFDDEVLECLDYLVGEALHQKHQSVEALALSPSQKTVLGVGKAESKVLYWVNQILWAKTQLETLPQQEVELQVLIASVGRLIKTVQGTVAPMQPIRETPISSQPTLLRGAFA